MRPTGKLHLGHYVGALENWISLQNEYDNFHLIADYHVLTTRLETEGIYQDSIDMLIDWLAAGLDPEKSPMFRQSQIKEHAELHLIFSMLIAESRLKRNPSLKDQIRDLHIENVSYGHLGYPVLQAADILLYKGDLVPVGEDQLPHIEITREISRSFNRTYGEVFPEPEPKLSVFARLTGLDGNAKMSKSLNNSILLSDEPAVVEAKIKKAVTDTQKVRKGDPGRPEICIIFSYHKKFNPAEVPDIDTNCRSGALGCADCKKKCISSINGFLEPFIAKRKEIEAKPDHVLNILHDGETKARKVASDTMQQVRQVMRIG
ncbi:MAG: Tryptophan--tRNA ligase [Ignavibacteriaceae bacterium]|nr:Tryptophan--tRNA ligase [Ignavibacteriaceae bacterium]